MTRARATPQCCKMTAVGKRSYRCQRFATTWVSKFCKEHGGEQPIATREQHRMTSKLDLRLKEMRIEEQQRMVPALVQNIREMTEEDRMEYCAIFSTVGHALGGKGRIGFRISYGMSRMCTWGH